jgi:FAD/FMN-containing dehydrogenase
MDRPVAAPLQGPSPVADSGRMPIISACAEPPPRRTGGDEADSVIRFEVMDIGTPGDGSADLDSLRAAFSGRLLTDPAATGPYLLDYRKRWQGAALAVALPDSTEDVAQIIRWCRQHRVAVVPQGGNTGLTGGSVPDRTGRTILLSLSRMNRIRAVDPLNNTITVEAGCVLQRVQDAAAEVNRLFPLSLAAQGTCTIGGNLATNAGGVQVIRFGNARDLCLGLEVVNAAGEIWNGLRGLRKDNTGYDLRDLFIGAEGTLGVITAAVLKLFPLPAARVAAFAGVESPGAALRLLELSQGRLGSSLTAFELMSRSAVDLVLKHFPGSRLPIETRCPWYVLLEVSDLDSDEHGNQAMEDLLSAAFDAGSVVDAAVSASIDQFRQFWALRESISDAQGLEGKNIKHDISLPISRVPEFITETDSLIEKSHPQTQMIVFGHLGDGNLHYNVSPRSADEGESAAARSPEADDRFLALEEPVNRIAHDAVARYGGSISAEHGLGVLRRDEAARYKQPVEIAMMRAIKQALDPQGLMNPGKVLPD